MSFWGRLLAPGQGSRSIPLSGKQSRTVMLLGGLAAVGVALLLLSSLLAEPGAVLPDQVPDNEISTRERVPDRSYPGLAETETMLEKRLAEILGQIDGAGEVSVRVTLAAGPFYQYTTNHNTANKMIEERDQAGGSRVTTENNDDGQLVLVQLDQYGGEQPLIQRELRAEVDGVLVVAEGASSARMRERLTRAVETVLRVPAYKISVLPREERTK